jgi:hypothetical protein
MVVVRGSAGVLAVAALLIAVIMAPMGQAPCPQKFADCGIHVPFPGGGVGGGPDGGSLSPHVSIQAGNQTVDATLNVTGTTSGPAKAGALAMVSYHLSSISMNDTPVEVRLSLIQSFGAAWDESPFQAYHYDPKVGAADGSFVFHVGKVAGSHLVIPVVFGVEDANGVRHSDVGVLDMDVAPAHTNLVAQWAMPFAIGLLVGIVIIVLLRRR